MSFLLTFAFLKHIIDIKKVLITMTTNDRIKQIRKLKNLTQQEFANRLGIKRSTISNYEMGRNNPVDSVISLICREFNVNEEWLRNGTGDMFLPENRQYEIEKAVRNLFTGEADSFKSRFITMLAKLSTSDWERLELEAMRLLNLKKEETSDSIEPTDIEERVAKAEEEYIKSISSSVKKTNSVALHTTKNIEENTNENKVI